MSERRAFISGITGQDGSYLAELLLEKGYSVYGLIRRTSSTNTWRLENILDQVHLIPGDLTDHSSLQRALKLVDPHEVYNFAAQSFVSHSFAVPLHTADVTGLGALRLFESIRQVCPLAKVYQASSSEQFGNPSLSPQDEHTAFAPVSPYGAAKTFAHQCAQIYRESYHLFIACGIAFNHESPRRGEEFVTRKITVTAAKIKAGVASELRLGDTSVLRDWSHAKDMVEAAWGMLQADSPDDYVLASGETHSVQEFYELVFNRLGLDPHHYVKHDPALLRPTEIRALVGFAAKAHRVLMWSPRYSFKELVYEMTDADALHYPALQVAR